MVQTICFTKHKGFCAHARNFSLFPVSFSAICYIFTLWYHGSRGESYAITVCSITELLGKKHVCFAFINEEEILILFLDHADI